MLFRSPPGPPRRLREVCGPVGVTRGRGSWGSTCVQGVWGAVFLRARPSPSIGLSQARTPLLTLRSGRRGQPCPVAWFWGTSLLWRWVQGEGSAVPPPQPRTPCHVCASTRMTARCTGTARSPPQPHLGRPALAGVSPPCLLSRALGARPPRLGRSPCRTWGFWFQAAPFTTRAKWPPRPAQPQPCKRPICPPRYASLSWTRRR